MAHSGLAWALALALAGCATSPWDAASRPGVSPAPERPWLPPSSAAFATPAPLPVAQPDRAYGLAELIDLGLARNPATRTAWLAARSAAAAVEAARSAYFPYVDVAATAARVRALGTAGIVEQTTWGPSVEASYLLFDFGGRRASVEQARQSLVLADWLHNAALADRVLAVTEAFHAHQGAIALAEAQRAAVKSAEASLAAADAQRTAGVATISDVLQAKTALSRARLLLESDDGNVVLTRADLNSAVGLPAAAPLRVEPLPGEMPVEELTRSVDSLVAAATERRPEIGAAVAQVRHAEARLEAVRSAGKPTGALAANAGRSYIDLSGTGYNTYTAALALRLPVFTGYLQRSNELQAQADLEQARARAETARQQVELDVVRSYQALATAIQRLRTAADLVASATSNEEVALGRYRAGAGSILELLTAQSALEDARAQDVQARADWLASVAALARAGGTNLPPAAAPAADQKGTKR